MRIAALVYLLCIALQGPPRYAYYYPMALNGQAPVVAFGDSITIGRDASNTEHMYVHLLGLNVDNRAVSGTVVREQVELQIRPYGGRARTATWLVCANDLYFRTPAAEFGATVQEGVDILSGRGIRVLLNRTCPPFPRKEAPGLVDAYNQQLAGIVGADLVALGDMPPTYFTDGTHPNDQGHAALASAYRTGLAARRPEETNGTTDHCPHRRAGGRTRQPRAGSQQADLCL